MADFKPFRGVRPPRDRAHLVASRSYISYSEKGLHDKLLANPFTFLHVIMPETKHKEFKDLDVVARFEIVKNEYKSFLEKGHVVKDEEPAFYLYRQTKLNHEYLGIIGGVASTDYESGVIKKHEETITKREGLFKKYLETTSFNAEPVLLAYEDSEKINSLTSKLTKKRPEYEFFTANEVKHEMWIIKKSKHIEQIQEEIKSLNGLYIADGHHRCASSALLSKECIGNDTSRKSHFMAMLIPKSSLKIYEYNRVIRDLNGLTVEDLLEKVSHDFDVQKMASSYKPEMMHTFGMYLERSWYKMILKDGKLGDDIVDQLDARILTHKILNPHLGIGDLKTDDRVGFVNGLDGVKKITERVDSGKYKVGFALFPASFEQLKKISDANLTMPPKSTWIEPKLRSGLTIYNLTED
ncbi:MAG: hypothetical protein ACI8XB_000627 [Patiriisocius sp.]|jgi:uncharacterized protein (DUF1015 family)